MEDDHKYTGQINIVNGLETKTVINAYNCTPFSLYDVIANPT